jgi:metal-sulfur cluster biosynthetic enzyme
MIEEAAIREALRQVVDPEIACNIVDLGRERTGVCQRNKLLHPSTSSGAGAAISSSWR